MSVHPHAELPIGARVEPGGTRFRVVARQAHKLDVVLEDGSATFPMTATTPGVFEVWAGGVGPGTLYRYRIDDGDLCADPASRYQPVGVHGPSMVVDPDLFHWSDGAWQGVPVEDLVLYELHVGTFTSAGNFDGVRDRLGYLQELGVTALALMPIADFTDQSWGYDPAAFFAPARAYGTPDDLRALVDAAHKHHIAVGLDVVYSHLGAEGDAITRFNPHFLTASHHTAFGPAVNLDAPGHSDVRAYLIENALYWLREFHLDGLQLDATWALEDNSPVHFLAELSQAVRTLPGPRRWLIAEDARNYNRLVQPVSAQGYGFDAVWVDDFHHQVRRTVAGEASSYADYAPSIADLGRTINQGWLYTGQRAAPLNRPRGTDPSGLSPHTMVYCIQDHAEVGNRAFGDHLSDVLPPAEYRAVSALLLFLPEIPRLFMGQEWGTATPFHSPLAWGELEHDLHASTLRCYRALLHLRKTLHGPAVAQTLGNDVLAVERGPLTLIVSFTNHVQADGNFGAVRWTSEDPTCVLAPMPPHVTRHRIYFARAAAVVAETVA